MNSPTRPPPGGCTGQTAEHRGGRCWCVMTCPFKGPAVARWSSPDANSSARAAGAGAPRMCFTCWPHGSLLVLRRPQRVKQPLVPLWTPPTAVPQCALAQAAPSESVCRIEGVARAGVSRRFRSKIDSPPARIISRVARDLTQFVFAQPNLSDSVQLARPSPAAGRQSARRRSHALTFGHRRPPHARRSACATRRYLFISVLRVARVVLGREGVRCKRCW